MVPVIRSMLSKNTPPDKQGIIACSLYLEGNYVEGLAKLYHRSIVLLPDLGRIFVSM